MSDAFTDVAKMRKIKEEVPRLMKEKWWKMTLENGRKRQKNRAKVV